MTTNDMPTWLCNIIAAAIAVVLGICIGYQQGRYDGAWGKDAVERHLRLLEHGYIIGSTHQLCGTHNPAAFVQTWRDLYAGKPFRSAQPPQEPSQ